MVVVDKTDSHNRYDMIIGQDLQHAIGMDILFSTQKLRWDGIEIPMRTANSKLIDLDKINSKHENIVDIFAITSSTMKIFDAM